MTRFDIHAEKKKYLINKVCGCEGFRVMVLKKFRLLKKKILTTYFTDQNLKNFAIVKYIF